MPSAAGFVAWTIAAAFGFAAWIRSELPTTLETDMPTPLEVNLSGQWNTFWSTLKQAVPSLPTVLGMLALIMVVCAIVMWVWGKRRNIRAGDNQILLGALAVGALFAAPDIVLPILLTIIDGVANFAIRLAGNVVN
ncbi:hypothetical protein [Microlunatus ginsengisoli]|uniref:hypothetical protein n=1 Tax=Microlunatus ginsengisoli TaxID=363863 RepID=UPI0031CEBD80